MKPTVSGNDGDNSRYDDFDDDDANNNEEKGSDGNQSDSCASDTNYSFV